MNWYTEGDVSIVATPVIRDNIVDTKTLTTSGDVYRGTMTRRYSIVEKKSFGWVCKIISLSYHTGYDSFNLKPKEPLNKYLSGEYVTLMEKQQPPEWNPAEWNGTVRMFDEQ